MRPPTLPLSAITPTSKIRAIAMTECDFCHGPVAGPSLEELVNRMNEYGWKITSDDEVICKNCLDTWNAQNPNSP